MIYILINCVCASYYTIPGYYGSFYKDFNATSISSVSFYWNSGFHISSRLDLWISDPSDNTVKYIQSSSYQYPKAALISVAGQTSIKGYEDGDLSTSLLNSPRSLYYYQDKVYVADTGNHCIRVIDINLKSIQQFVGMCQQPGFKDGPVGYNLLHSPDLVGIENNTMFINDSGNNYIRVVNLTTGYMNTLLGGACRDSSNITTTYPQPSYDIKNSIFYSNRANMHTIVCDTHMIKTTGDQIFTSSDIITPCVEHAILCQKRTSPYVARNYIF
jgi:NHL repeat